VARIASLLAFAAVLVAPLGAGAAGGAEGAQACRAANAVTLIADDSQSMQFEDPARNRAEAQKLLLAKAANRGGATYAGVEFGADAGIAFPAQRVTRGNVGALAANIDRRTNADEFDPARRGGGTDYNAAFRVAKSAAPAAKAWVFLTDGAHNRGVYANGHVGGPPTYVVGFGDSGTPANAARLRKIVADNGGRYFPETGSGNLTTVVDRIDQAFRCAKVRTFASTFARAGQRRSYSAKLGKGVRSVELTLTWSNPAATFALERLRVTSGSRLVGFARARKLKVARRGGKTFLTARVIGKGLRGKRLGFRVKAKKLGAASVRVTTTVAQVR
jgi:hypothetical protein